LHERWPGRAAGALQGGLSVQPAEYPAVWRNDSLVEDYHGEPVHDPYRWLEATDSPETRACAAPLSCRLLSCPARRAGPGAARGGGARATRWAGGRALTGRGARAQSWRRR